MTREQIEKAANIYMLSYYSDEEYPCDIKDIQSDFIDAFSRGAEWRINSVWHDDISECKDVKRWIVVEYNNGYIDVLPDIRDLDGVKDLVVRVAYVDDLLPERKEETK